jgi:hypothetical protein
MGIMRIGHASLRVMDMALPLLSTTKRCWA